MMVNSKLTRRSMLGGAAAAGVVLVAGTANAAAKTKITMHRNPSCGCCMKWVEKARAAGFDVTVAETDDIMAVKRKLGVPQAVTSCHTSVAEGYVIEGHVPFDAITKLLRTKPKIRGIAVPGMPLGSPGMEVPGYAGDAFEVLAFDAAGNVKRFA